jgi:hypothetical protein
MRHKDFRDFLNLNSNRCEKISRHIYFYSIMINGFTLITEAQRFMGIVSLWYFTKSILFCQAVP